MKRASLGSDGDEQPNDDPTHAASSTSAITVSFDPTSADAIAASIGEGAFVGEYRLEKRIGQGGMGEVWSAHHRADGRTVAIKILSPTLLHDDPTAVPRFMREAKVCSKLTSPHAVRVMDFGTLPSGVPYIVMELLVGDTLHAHLRAAPNTQLPAYVAVDFIVQACAAVGEAHEAGIIHRDLKLNNLFLAHKGPDYCILKVLDFGLAKPQRQVGDNEPSAVSLTQAGAFFGTPQYMSPEQMIGVREVDPRIDVWSLGVCLYAMITGTYPFHGDDAQAICRMVLSGEHVPASQMRPDLSPAIEAVISRCLAPTSKRYANATELADALREAVPPRSDRDITVAMASPLPDSEPGNQGPISRTRILFSPQVAAAQQQQQQPAATAPSPSIRPSATPQLPFTPRAAQPSSQPQQPRAQGFAPPPPQQQQQQPQQQQYQQPQQQQQPQQAMRRREVQRTVLVPRKSRSARLIAMAMAVTIVVLIAAAIAISSPMWRPKLKSN